MTIPSKDLEPLNIIYEQSLMVIAVHRGVSIEALRAVVDSIAKIDSTSAMENPMPALPNETYSQAHKEKGENIIEFLERVWRPFIEAKVITLRDMRSFDVSVTDAIDNFERLSKDGKTRKRIPAHLRFPKISEVPHCKRGKRALAESPRSPAFIGLVLGRLAKETVAP